MSLPLPLAAAADLFVESFSAYDTTSVLSDGRWVPTQEADRTISGVIQTDKEKDVLLESDGALSDGDLMFHTRSAVSANDLSQDGQVLRQTYVRYGDEVWKLQRLSNWKPKAQGYNKYSLTKYTNIDE